ncbi:hypothetical protein OHC33_006147 [Knufia fluminis]|uniref:Uncharacterized protein n=1 Tax=Knufia fluminis TaxID=191047 RepID=A0AAN8EP92_9EURO|nr:hypothetical protein OHC33_006147 [Knufia fluminis]
MSNTDEEQSPPPIKTLKQYYEMIMDKSAAKGSGILLPFPPEEYFVTLGDFAYTEHTWTEPQKHAWKQSRTPPITFTDLPDTAKMVMQTVHFPYVRHRGDGSRQLDQEVRLTPADFRKLERTTQPGIGVWVLGVGECDVLMIPSLEIVIEDGVRRVYAEGRAREDGADGVLLSMCLRRREA